MLKEALGNSSKCHIAKKKKLVASDLEKKKRRRGKYIRSGLEKIFCCIVE